MNTRSFRLAAAATLCLAACAVAPSANDVRAQDDEAQANSHDDGWQDAWVAQARSVYRAASKTEGMVLHVGDSITHANPYTQWPRHGAGKTAEDAEIAAWSHATVPWPAPQNDVTQANGWYLAAADTTGGRGMTTAGGITTGEFLSGSGNGGTAMPRADDPAEARRVIADAATYSANLQIHTVAEAFAEAQFAVLMLGTNDASAGRSRAAFLGDLEAIIEALEARDIVVIPSTIPPHIGARAVAEDYNQGIRDLARERALPLIDYEAEILARRPGDSWNGTLLGAGDVHPTAQRAGFHAASDPYTPGGDPTAHRTGDACREVGYLLRSWLTVEKLKEVKRLVADQAGASITPGDCNGDRAIDLSDGVCLLGHLFQGRPAALPCDGADAAANVALLDANGDGDLDVSDAVYLLDFLFAGTPGHALGLECVAIIGCPERCGA